MSQSFFFFNDTATTEIYTLSLHDALPISMLEQKINSIRQPTEVVILPEMFSTGFSMQPHLFAENMNGETVQWMKKIDRKSTRLNSSHGYISYAVFCLKKKKKRITTITGAH